MKLIILAFLYYGEFVKNSISGGICGTFLNRRNVIFHVSRQVDDHVAVTKRTYFYRTGDMIT